VSRTPAGGHGYLKKKVFCGVLRCFAVFCVRVFSVFHKTAQNRPKNIQNAQKEQNTLCAIQRNTVLCVFLSLRKCLCLLQKTFAKHVQNIAKHSQDTAKHRKTLFFEKHLQNTAKHPQNTCKTPQNIAKHHKTDLLTKQTELANNPLRSRKSLPCGKAVVVGLQAGALGTAPQRGAACVAAGGAARSWAGSVP